VSDEATPDESKWSEDPSIEQIRRFVLLRFYQSPTHRDFWRVAETYQHLSVEEKHELDLYTEQLRNSIRESGRSVMEGVLLALACLINVAYPGHPGPSPMARLRRMGLQQGVTTWAANWLEETSRCLDAYSVLSISERDKLTEFARRRGIDLPKYRPEAPEEVLHALGRLEALIPVRPGADVPEEALLAVCPLERRTCLRDEDELYDVYQDVSLHDARELATRVVRLWATDPAMLEHDLVEHVLLHLSHVFPGSLRGLHGALIDEEVYYPCELYRDADAGSRDRLLRLMEDGRRTHGALAWIGDEVVQSTFHRLRQSQSSWIYASVTKEAGWELTESGGRRDLYHQECYQLVPTEGKRANVDPGPIAVITPHEERCPWCRKRLVTLFDIDLRDPRLTFLAPGWERLRIAMCRSCTGSECIYSDVDPHGGCHWSARNVRRGNVSLAQYRRWASGAGYSYPRCRLVLGQRRRSPFEAQFATRRHAGSQVGGFPTWEDGTSHPTCPKCDRLMVFIGQILTNEALGDPFTEGVTYGFLCQQCQIAATTYEQT
jgi:hypothetical protein